MRGKRKTEKRETTKRYMTRERADMKKMGREKFDKVNRKGGKVPKHPRH